MRRYDLIHNRAIAWAGGGAPEELAHRASSVDRDGTSALGNLARRRRKATTALRILVVRHIITFQACQTRLRIRAPEQVACPPVC